MTRVTTTESLPYEPPTDIRYLTTKQMTMVLVHEDTCKTLFVITFIIFGHIPDPLGYFGLGTEQGE